MTDTTHPLATRKTELIWEGKYDTDGNRRPVDITAATLPLQHIEQVDQPRSEAFATGTLELFEKANKRQDDFCNRLIWGDNKVVMASLLSEFRGKVNLIYADPPFNIGADFTMDVPIGDAKAKVPKDASALETVAYCDIWGKGTDSYLHFMFERLTLMRDLLADDGSIYLHCDPTMSHYLKLLMDEIFGENRFRNEIIWGYKSTSQAQKWFPRKHDVILFYTKSDNWTFNTDDIRVPFATKSLAAHGSGGAWKSGTESERAAIHAKGKVVEDWWEIPMLNSMAKERLGYPTQKPKALLERIIKASSNEGNIVFDPFCGSGTTGAVAEQLGRKWIMSDLGRFGIHTTRKRMIDIQRERHHAEKPYRAFGVYNAGKYERQWWQQEHLQGAEREHRRVVLELFGAEVLPPENQPSPYLHGFKDGAYCYIAPIDTLFGKADAEELISKTTYHLISSGGG